MTVTIINLSVVAGELSVLAIACFLLWWMIKQGFRRLQRFPGLRPQSKLIVVGQKKFFYLVLLLWAILSLLTIGVNVALWVQGQALWPATLAFVRRLPPDFWIQTVNSLLESALIIGLAVLFHQLCLYLVRRVSGWVEKKHYPLEDKATINQFFQSLIFHLSNGTFLCALLLCSQAFGLKVISTYLFTGFKVYGAIAIGLILLKISDVVIDGLNEFSAGYIRRHPALQAYSQLRQLVPFLKRCLEYVIYLSIATLVVAQINLLIGLVELGTRLLQVLGIVLASRILIAVSGILVNELLGDSQKLNEVQRKRRMTLVPILQSMAKYGIYFWAGILILRAIAIDPTPILAAAGLVGLAVGLGAQNLINDTVSGFFILLENYFLVGDYIQVGESEGVVEAIELRTTRIRHPNGQLQILRNGDVTSIVNFSREYIYAVVDVGVAYDSDLNKVYQVIEDVGIEIQQLFPKDVLEPTEVDGLEAFGQSKLMVRAVTKLKPNDSRRGVHDDIQGELRKILKEAFDRAGIVMPVSQAIGVIENADGP
ncbi:MAG: mechanosensitive ion channel family protein [Cyanobacteria bacterium P01_F01_bin.150]